MKWKKAKEMGESPFPFLIHDSRYPQSRKAFSGGRCSRSK